MVRYLKTIPFCHQKIFQINLYDQKKELNTNIATNDLQLTFTAKTDLFCTKLTFSFDLSSPLKKIKNGIIYHCNLFCIFSKFNDLANFFDPWPEKFTGNKRWQLRVIRVPYDLSKKCYVNYPLPLWNVYRIIC